MVESKSSQQQPCLLITDRPGENCRIQTNMFNNKPQLLYDVGGEIPEFLGRYIDGSFGEWVLLGGSSDHILVNLLSREIIELPFLEFTINLCTLTSHPYDPACHVVYFDDGNFLIFCQPGDREFTIKKWDGEFFPTSGAVVAGKLLVVREPFSRVGVIEFKESTYRFEVVEMDFASRDTTTIGSAPVHCECSGELFVMYRTYCGTYLMGFGIFKADLLNKKWVSVKNLGTLSIFIDNETAHVVECASSVESGIKANSIYFLKRFDLDNYYIYNLEDGTVRMKPIFSSSMEMETTEDTRLDWIMMPCEASFRKLLKRDQEDSDKEDKPSVEVEEDGVQNSWNMVPPELLNLIQLHLFGRDHAVFGVVCKAWQQVSIQDHSIPALLASTTLLELCQSSSPLLMFQEDLTISDDSVPIFRFFDPVHRKVYRMEIPELRGTDIQCLKDGWLLVSRRSDKSIFFFNPLTQEKIDLPRMPSDSDFSAKPYSLSFSSLPTCSNCLIIGIASSAMLYTLKHGEETWREQEMGEFWWGEYVPCPVVLNGLHHFMCADRDMVVFNWKDGVEGQLPYCQRWSYKVEQLKYLPGDDFFLEIDGALIIVSADPDRGEIRFFKWNELETEWELIEGGGCFGGEEMFLSRRGSFMEKIDDVGGMGNTIFLPMIDDAKEGVFYSLATHKYHTLYRGYSSELPYNVDQILNGIWVKPDRKVVGDSNLKWFM